VREVERAGWSVEEVEEEKEEEVEVWVELRESVVSGWSWYGKGWEEEERQLPSTCRGRAGLPIDRAVGGTGGWWIGRRHLLRSWTESRMGFK
jgi:hypothetical protein